MPTMRDPDLLRLLQAGGARHRRSAAMSQTRRPSAPHGIPPDFGQQLLPENFDRFEQLARWPPPSARRSSRRWASAQLINGPIPYLGRRRLRHGQGAGARQRLRRARASLYGIAGGGGAGADDGGVDRARAAQPRPLAARHPALLLPPHHHAPSCIDRARRALRQALRDGLSARRSIDARPRHPAQPALRPAEGAGRRLRLARRLGAAELVRARGHRARATGPSFGRPNWFEHGGRRAPRRARAGRADRPDLLRQDRDSRAPARWRRCSGSRPPTWTSPSAASSTPSSATSAAASSATSPSRRLDEDRFYIVTGSAFAHA